MSNARTRPARSRRLRTPLLLLALVGFLLTAFHVLTGDVSQAATPLLLALALVTIAVSDLGRLR